MFNKTKLRHWLLSLTLLTPLVAGLVGSQLVFAADPTPTPTPTPTPESLTLTCDYPALKDASSNIFSYNVVVRYEGTQAKVFDLVTQLPPGAASRILNSSSAEITSLRIDPNQFSSNSITVQFSPTGSSVAVPGQYSFSLSAKSGSLSASVQLTALVTPKYGLHMTPQSGVFKADISAGQANSIAIRLLNQGTVPLNSVSLSATGPKGWEVSFSPDKIDTPIPANFEVKADLVVKPPSNATAGDYDIKIKADSGDATDSNSIRVTVKGSDIGGWVGIIAVVAVITGLGILFRRMGKR